MNTTLTIPSGLYNFTASLDYPQLTRLAPDEAINPQSQSLLSQNPDETTSLSFLASSSKLLAGAWRLLTYFGRDTLIFLLLAQPVLSDVAIQVIISAAIERINGTIGAVCHEETIGDYATYQNLQMRGVGNTAPGCSYIMIDSEYYLPIALNSYYEKSPAETIALLNR